MFKLLSLVFILTYIRVMYIFKKKLRMAASLDYEFPYKLVTSYVILPLFSKVIQ